MATWKTFDKQSGTFVAAVAQQIPKLLTGKEMQYLIENPEELADRLKILVPTLRQLTQWCDDVEFIELDPSWDFLIMRSKKYPEVGIAVSNHSGSCGKGLRLAIETEKRQGIFAGPCGCCYWYPTPEGKDVAVDTLRKACKTANITHLIFNCWHDAMTQEDELTLIDPYKEKQMKILDYQRFATAYGWLQVAKSDGEIKPLSYLF